ncbi:outer membrane beta-barrel protein [Anaeromyxobacter oryzisoli]|uniref:outer membrane beta-barrel protein n=1 Tax=Anaeromyxobacter oryzisoli TaxID=2925408 RepID=UPI001F59B53D|nr:outer membrane beta-barrel protein [Anaeromyxobacter sp. SG63]
MKKMSVAIAALAVLASLPAQARAQEKSRRFEIAPLVGAYLPTGGQRDMLDDSVLAGLTVSYDVIPYAAVVGAFSWAPTHAKGVGNGDLDLFQYDLGVQGQLPIALSGDLTLKPFVGVGAGARTYSFRDLNVDSETDFAGYVSAGASLQYQAVAVSLTARDYLTPFNGIGRETSTQTRNDLALFGSVGVRF